MNEVEFETAPPPQRPRTTTVLAVLVLTAAVLSYLGAYAMANALVAAEVLRPWSRDNDPRFGWFVAGFFILITLFTGIGAAARFISARHLKQIEETEQETG